MTYAYLVDVPAPIEAYDAVHAAVDRRSGGHADGLIVHFARTTPTGFQVLEIWESKDQADRFGAEVVGPAMAEDGGPAAEGPEPERVEFEARGLMGAGVRAATAT
jgi:hypothetical protein